MKHWPILLTTAALLAIVPVMSAHAQENTLKALMLKKLQNSQQGLDGLALGDFDKIGKHKG